MSTESVFPIGSFNPAKILESTYLFKIEYQKSHDLLHVTELSNLLSALGLNYSNDLYYRTPSSRGSDYPRLFACISSKGEKLKGRVCDSESTAETIASCIDKALDLEISTSRVYHREGRILITEFLEGSNPELLSGKEIATVAKMISTIEVEYPGLEPQISEMMETCLADSNRILGNTEQSNSIHAWLSHEMPQLTPVFDHTDWGMHNLLRSPNGVLHLVDEEAFGIIPFGYSISRALNGDYPFVIISEPTDRDMLLSQFPQEKVTAFLSAENFWKVFYNFRNAARSTFRGNADKSLVYLKRSLETIYG
jgi:hypothetical protein